MDGYWNFVTASLVLLAIVYITMHGQLKQWISLLSFSTAATPQVGGSAATPQGSSAADKNSAAGGAGNAQDWTHVGGLNALTGGWLGSAGTQITPAGQSLLQGLLKDPMGVIGGLIGGAGK